jgi:acyl dehydratase
MILSKFRKEFDNMANQSSLLEKLRGEIGKESPPRSEEVEKGAIRRYVNALGDHNPLYEDEAFAKKSRYGGKIAPPLFVVTFNRVRRPKADPRMGKSTVNAGNEYEFFLPIRPGDIITHTSKITDVKERSTKMGRSYICVRETTFVNQKGEKVAIARQSLITW